MTAPFRWEELRRLEEEERQREDAQRRVAEVNKRREGSELGGRFAAGFKEQGLRSLAALAELTGTAAGAVGFDAYKRVADESVADYRSLANAIDDYYAPAQTGPGMVAGGAGVLAANVLPMMGMTRGVAAAARASGGGSTAARVAQKVLGPEITREMSAGRMLGAVAQQNIGGSLIAAPILTVPEALSSDPYDSPVGGIAATSRQFREAGWEPTGGLERLAAGAGGVAERLDAMGPMGRIAGGVALDAGLGTFLEGTVRSAGRGVGAAARAMRSPDPTTLDLRGGFGDATARRAESAARLDRAKTDWELDQAMLDGRVLAEPTRPAALEAEPPSPIAQATRQFDEQVTAGQARRAEAERRAAMSSEQRSAVDRMDPLDEGWETRRRADGRNLFGAAAAPLALSEDDETPPWALGAAAFGAALATRGRGARGMGDDFASSLFSRLGRRIAEAPFQRGTAQQWKAHLSQNVAAGEREWTGIDRLLNESAPDKVLTREEIQSVFDKHQLKVLTTEREMGGPYERMRLQDELRRAEDDVDKIRDSLSELASEYPSLDAESGARVAAMARRLRSASDYAEDLRRQLDNFSATKYHEDAGRVGDKSIIGSALRRERDNYFEDTIELGSPSGSKPYESSHWDEENVIAHVRGRFEDTPDGRALIAEEVQSDWHQEAAEPLRVGKNTVVKDATGKTVRLGYDTLEDTQRFTESVNSRYEQLADERGSILRRIYEPGNESEDIPALRRQLDATTREMESLTDTMADFASGARGAPPPGPFAKTPEWSELGLKKLIDRALRKNADWVVLPRGQQVSEAMGVGRALPNGLDATRSPDGTWLLQSGGTNIPNGAGIPDAELGKYVGENVAATIRAKAAESVTGTTSSLRGEDLTFRSPGMDKFYDEMLPNTARAYLKTLGASVEPAPASMGEFAGNPAIRITPELRDRIGSEGQRLWSQAAAPLGGAGVTATADDERSPWEVPLGGAAFLGAIASRGRGARGAARAAAKQAADLANATRVGGRIAQEAASTSRYGWMPKANAGTPQQERQLVNAVNKAERAALPELDRLLSGEREGLGMFFGERSPMTLTDFAPNLTDAEMRRASALRGLLRGQAAQLSTRSAAPGDAPMAPDGVTGLTARAVVTMPNATMVEADAERLLAALAKEGIAGGTFDKQGGALLFDNIRRYTSLDDESFVRRIAEVLERPEFDADFSLSRDPIYAEYLDGPSDYLRAIGRDAEALLGVQSALDALEPVYANHARAIGFDESAVAQRFATVRDALSAAVEQLAEAPPVGNTKGGRKLPEVARELYARFSPLNTRDVRQATPEMARRLRSVIESLFEDDVFPRELMENWYEGATSIQERIAKLIIPELAQDPKRVLYHIVNAIASNGQEVPVESRVGLQVMDQFVRTGRFSLLDPESPEYRDGVAHVQSLTGGKKGLNAPYGRGPAGERIPGSPRTLGIEQAYARLDALVQEFGEAGAVERLLQAMTFSGRERIGRTKRTRGVQKTELSLETLFGQKIGRYAGDKLGLPDFGGSTIDLWMARLYHMLTGNAKGRAVGKTGKLNDNVTAEMRKVMEATLAEYGRQYGLPPSGAQALAWYAIKYAFRKGGAREKAKAYATLGSATLDAIVDPKPLPPDLAVAGRQLAGMRPGADGTPGWTSDASLETWSRRAKEVVSPKEGPFAGTRFGRGAAANDISGVAMQGVRAAVTDPLIGGAVGAGAGALQADEGERLKGAALGAAVGAGVGAVGRAVVRGAEAPSRPAAPPPKGAPAGVDPVNAPPAPGGSATLPARQGGRVLRESPMGEAKLDEYALNPSLHTLDPEGLRVTELMESQLIREGYRRGKVGDAELAELSDALDPSEYKLGDVRNLDAVRVVALARRGKANRELYSQRLSDLEARRGQMTPAEVEKVEAELDALMSQMIADDKVLNQSASDLGRGLRLFSRLASMQGSYGALAHAAKKVLGVTELPQHVEEALGRIHGSASMTPQQKSVAVQRELQKATKVSLWELVTGGRRAWLLSALPSHMVNLLGSVSEAGPKQLIINPVMAAMDKLYASLTGQERVATMTGRLGGYREGFKAGIGKGFRKETFQGIDPERPLETLRRERASYVASLGLDEQAGESAWRKNLRGAAKVMQAADDAIMGTMAAMDRPFYEASLQAALMERAALRAMREGLKEGDAAFTARVQELLKPENIAIEDAAMAVVEAMDDTFKVAKVTAMGAEQGSSLPSKMLSASKRLVESNVPMAASAYSGAVDMTVPFVNTPSVLVRKGLENVPGLGLGVGALQADALRRALKNLNLPEAELAKVQSRESRRRMLESLSRSLTTGGGLVMAGYLMTKAGVMTGEYSPAMGRDEDEQAEARERAVTGQPAMSIRIGDRAHQLTGFAQYLAPLALGHALAQVDDPISLKGAAQATGKGAKAMGRAVIELPMLQGTKDLVEAMEGSRPLPEFAARQAASFIPYGSAIAMGARMTDDIGPRAPETPWEIVQERLPGLRQNVPPKMGPLGEVMPRTSRVELALSPTRPQRVRTGQLSPEYSGTYEQMLEAGFRPGPAARREGETGWEYATRRQVEGATERALIGGLLAGDPGAWAFTTPLMRQRFGEAQDWESLLRSAVGRQRSATSRAARVAQGMNP